MNNVKDKEVINFLRLPLEKRKNTSNKILFKYPDRIPVIVSRFETKHTPRVEKHKYLVPDHFTFGQLIFEIRKHINVVRPDASLFFFVNSKTISSSLPLNVVYQNEKNDDGFLYVLYATENTFG